MDPNKRQMTPSEMQSSIEDLQERLKVAEGAIALPDHYHNGFDSNLISWVSISQKKLFVHHTIVGTAAATATNYGVFYIVPLPCLVTRIQEVHMTAGSDAGAVSLNIEKLTSTQALDGGAAILSTAFNLKGTANTIQTGTLSGTASSRTLATGDRLAMDDAGTLTAVANVTVLIELQLN